VHGNRHIGPVGNVDPVASGVVADAVEYDAAFRIPNDDVGTDNGAVADAARQGEAFALLEILLAAARTSA
jgi:hypothetical protein